MDLQVVVFGAESDLVLYPLFLVLSHNSDHALNLNTVELVKFRNSVTQPQPTSPVSDQARDKKAPHFLESWVVDPADSLQRSHRSSGPSLNYLKLISIHFNSSRCGWGLVI